MSNLTLEVSVPSFDGAWLAGTLELPANARGIVIPVHGSFPQTRDGNVDDTRRWMFPNPVPKRNLFLSFRDALAPLGFGTYRYDKRASGQSEGIWAETDFLTIARDMLAVFTEVKRRYPQLLIGVMGQSEGCLTCLKAIELGATPDFFISQGGALEDYLSLIDRQKDRAAKPFLADKTGALEAQAPLLALYYREYFEGGLRREIASGHSRHYVLENKAGYRAVMNVDLYRQYDQFSPMQVLAQFKKPALLINGSADLNVPTSAIETIQAKQRQGEYPHVTCAILPDLEHSFRRANPNETMFEIMAKPVDPLYAQTLAQFLTVLK